MSRRRIFVASLLGLGASALLGRSSVGVAADPPPRAIGPGQRCAVCRMYPARYPKWMAQILFSDGAMAAFESPAELFRFLQDMPRYDKDHSVADVAAVYVTDYENGGWMAARSALFVAGSRIRGPMGADLPAFRSRAQARAFAVREGGRILNFGEITPDTLAGLRDHDHPADRKHMR